MQRRNTNQKQIVLDSLDFLGHADTEKLISYINDHYEKISLATIYRNLSILLEDNLIAKIKIGDIDVYEIKKKKHYHYKCNSCGAIIDVDPTKISLNLNGIHKIGNDNVSECDIVFYGVCHDCKSIH